MIPSNALRKSKQACVKEWYKIKFELQRKKQLASIKKMSFG
jgi:hypothetical protein